MVRGTPAVLADAARQPLIAVYGGTLALLLAAPLLPAVGGTGDLNTALSDVPTMLALGACALVLLPGRGQVGLLALVALGAGLLGAVFTVAGPIALADLAKALFAGSLGLVLARVLAEPIAVVGVPLFVAAIDVLSVAGGPTSLLSRDSSRAGDFLSLYVPAWGGGRAGVLGVADLVFVGLFAGWAWRFGLRRRATAASLLAALPLALLAELAIDRVIPAIPLLGAALLLPNLDRLPGLVRGAPPS